MALARIGPHGPTPIPEVGAVQERPAEDSPATEGDGPAPTSARGGKDDSGRETQPASRDSVEQSAETAERLDRQSRSFDDAAGINPDRGQDSTSEPGRSDER